MKEDKVKRGANCFSSNPLTRLSIIIKVLFKGLTSSANQQHFSFPFPFPFFYENVDLFNRMYM